MDDRKTQVDMPELKMLENELRYEKQKRKWIHITVALLIIAAIIIMFSVL